MMISGNLLIGGQARRGSNGVFVGFDAATGQPLEGSFGGATVADLDEAAALAWQAFGIYRQTSLHLRSRFLLQVADEIAVLGEDLISRCMAETGLPRVRIEGEKARTVGQLRLFAAVVRDGSYLEARIDPGLPDRKPLPRPDLRLMKVPLGPVAVFGASNFPLAFSVAGGDTASALAAGCPVIVKAHSAHPGTSELVGLAVQRAVRTCSLPEGVFSLIYDSGKDISQALVAHPQIRAVGFTGSRSGGTAFMKIAAARNQPIPVYAEMSSINPVILFPGALARRGAAIGRAFVNSLTLGAGQFCTSPGLILAEQGPGLEAFIRAATEALSSVPAATMLSDGIRNNYCAAVEQRASRRGVELLAKGLLASERRAQSVLFSTDAKTLLANVDLQDEIFGAASLVVRCIDREELAKVVHCLEGQLTIAIHIDPEDYHSARKMLPVLEGLAGRILVNGFGTGVEVAHAMVHGGPYPATSDGRSTSVGSLAIERFLRPICFQDMPDDLLPRALSDQNPEFVRGMENGELPS
ncbi:aldehyde dehydrogenase (NADP(+)) [Bradyrhizobium sp. USDA 4449]